jgi:hypothetical protein
VSTNHDCITLMTQFVDLRPSGFSGYPARIPVSRSDLPIQRDGHLQMNEWPAAAHEVNVRFIQSGGFSGQAARADFNPGLP